MKKCQSFVCLEKLKLQFEEKNDAIKLSFDAERLKKSQNWHFLLNKNGWSAAFELRKWKIAQTFREKIVLLHLTWIC